MDSDSKTGLISGASGAPTSTTDNEKKEDDATAASATSSLNPKTTFGSAIPVQSVSFDAQVDQMESEKKEREKENDKVGGGSSLKQGSISKEDALKKYLPYYREFHSRKEKSVLSFKDFNNDPEGYLDAILKKYTIDHPKDIHQQHTQNNENNEKKEKEKETESKDNEKKESEYLYPWIEGTMDKLMPEAGVFGRVRYKSRLFRLFDEALVWFDDTNILKKWLEKNVETMKPLGVLPLAMITALRTVDMTKSDNDISEDDLLKLELQIGNEGVIVLRCSDFRQRIKWFECLHCAIFSVVKPVFTQKQGLWRISEEGGKNISPDKQLTTYKVSDKEELNRKLKNIHVRMGTSLVLTVEKLKKQMSQHPSSGGSGNGSVGGLQLDSAGGSDDEMDNEEILDGVNTGINDNDDNNTKDKNKNSNSNENDRKENGDSEIEMNLVNQSSNNNDNSNNDLPKLKNTSSSNNSQKPNRKIL